MNTLGLLIVCLVAFASLVGAAVHNANDHPVLYNFICNANWPENPGNNIVDNGDSVTVGIGTFSGAPYATSITVYSINEIYFSLVCSGAPHTCILDGLNSRMIMRINSPAGDLRLSGIHFKDAYYNNFGAGLAITGSSNSASIVYIEVCKFSSSNQDLYPSSQAPYIGVLGLSSWGKANLYSTSFVGTSGGGGTAKISTYKPGRRSLFLLPAHQAGVAHQRLALTWIPTTVQGLLI